MLWDDGHDDANEWGRCDRCTPEKLLAFIKRSLAITGKQPTLLECKKEFGGILGPMVDYWKLKEQGLIPTKGT